MPDTSLTPPQAAKLRDLCRRYKVDFDPAHYQPQFDLPSGWVGGWVGGPARAANLRALGTLGTIYVGVSPEGDSSS